MLGTSSRVLAPLVRQTWLTHSRVAELAPVFSQLVVGATSHPRQFLSKAHSSRSRVTSSRPPRTFASFSKAAIEPVELSYDEVQPRKLTAEDQCLVVCHGLFGSKQNWRSLAKMFAHKLGMPVYTLDMRNHGHSPHAEPHTYAAMAVDIAHFISKHNLKGVNLLGHSMGGKAVMAYALNEEYNGPLRTLIIVDISPARGKISPEFASYTEGMIEVEKAKVRSKSEADKILQKVEPLLPTRQFLLTNTRIHPDGHLTFRIPLDLLTAAIPSIGDFPYTPPPPVGPSSPQWRGPTLFIKGEQSRYLNRHNIPVSEQFFPNMRLEVLDTGHWVHAEKPAETMTLVEEFVKEARK